MASPGIRVSVPEVVIRDPVQAVIDGLTVIHARGGDDAVEKALTVVIDVFYDRRKDG